MKKRTSPILFSIIIFLLLAFPVFGLDNHTVQEEREGKVIWDKLQQKQLSCDKSSDEDFERLGE